MSLDFGCRVEQNKKTWPTGAGDEGFIIKRLQTEMKFFSNATLLKTNDVHVTPSDYRSVKCNIELIHIQMMV